MLQTEPTEPDPDPEPEPEPEPEPPPPPPSGPALAFPGAEGFGRHTRHAYACGSPPSVQRVTNLNDSGTGSLRAALTASGPRFVVSETSGTVPLQSAITITSPCLFFAGETAPGKGLSVRNYGIIVKTHDVVLRHLRARIGTLTTDGFNAFDTQSYNIVLDHLSVAWATDGSIDVGPGRGLLERNITISNFLIMEHLRGTANHSRAILLYDDSQRVSVLKGLIAHIGTRLPVCQGGVKCVAANVLVYNQFETIGTHINDANNVNRPIFASIVGMRYIQGPNTASGTATVRIRTSVDLGSKVYLNDNTSEGSKYTGVRNDVTAFNPLVSSPPSEAPLDGVNVLPSSQVEAYVLANAGARPKDRDEIDARAAQEVQSRTGSVKDTAGTHPTIPVVTRAFTVPSDPHGDSDKDGYTNLEEEIHKFAAAVEN